MSDKNQIVEKAHRNVSAGSTRGALSRRNMLLAGSTELRDGGRPPLTAATTSRPPTDMPAGDRAAGN